MDDVLSLATFDGRYKDGIAVIIVENKDVVVTSTGNERKSTREVSADYSFEVIHFESGRAHLVFTFCRF